MVLNLSQHAPLNSPTVSKKDKLSFGQREDTVPTGTVLNKRNPKESVFAWAHSPNETVFYIICDMRSLILQRSQM